MREGKWEREKGEVWGGERGGRSSEGPGSPATRGGSNHASHFTDADTEQPGGEKAEPGGHNQGESLSPRYLA